MPPLVVVVEDDPSSRTSLGRVLRAGGFETAMYASAEEFLESPPEPTPICLLLDIQLGGLSGLELQRRLRAQGSRVPFIAITAFDSESAREEARALGCIAYLRKPCEGSTIVRLIRSLG
jgi:FixJ family two-component response regulator